MDGRSCDGIFVREDADDIGTPIDLAIETLDRIDGVDFWETTSLHVRRVKQGTPSTHPIPGDEQTKLGGARPSMPGRVCSRFPVTFPPRYKFRPKGRLIDL